MPGDTRKFSNPSPFGAAIRGAIDQNNLGEKLRPHQALALWPEVAGEAIAAACEAEAVRGGVLFVRAKSSAWANEMTFYKADLLTRLNLRLGGKVLDDIHFSTAGRGGARSVKAKEVSKPTEPQDLGRFAPPAPSVTDPTHPEIRLNALVARTKAVNAWKRQNGWIECPRCDALFEASVTPRKGAKRQKARERVCPVCRALVER